MALCGYEILLPPYNGHFWKLFYPLPKTFLLFSDGANLLADRSYCRSVKGVFASQSLIEQEKNTAKADYDSGAVRQSGFVRRLADF